MTYLFLDTETTGFRNPRLVSIAYSRDDEHVFHYGVYKPGKPIEDTAWAVHHISNEMVKDLPLFSDPKNTDFMKLQQLVSDHIVVAHNLDFDRSVLENEGIKVRRGLCTLELARRLYPTLKMHKLGFLEKWLNIDFKLAPAHSALGDAQTLKSLFYAIRGGLMNTFDNDSARVDSFLADFVRSFEA